jgi:predicted RNA-binding Zn-ribbon protein involved in translation (DUF1610 family)
LKIQKSVPDGLDSKKIMFNSIVQSSKEEMINEIHRLLDEADVVIHYNGRKFDIPTLNKEFLLNGLKPPSPYKQIDVLETVKKKFRFPSNKLDYVVKALGIGNKLNHDGHILWVKCMAGDLSAWKTMKKYNIQDIKLLEDVYIKVLPWIDHHPNYSLFDDNIPSHSCPNCGSTHLVKRGIAITEAARWQRYSCGDCGKWSRGEKIKKNIKYSKTDHINKK